MQMETPNYAFKKKVKGVVLAGTLLITSALIGVNCSGFKATGDGSDSFGSLGGADKEMAVGFLSSDQMLKSMISVAGVESLGDVTTADDAAIDSTFTQRAGSLPSVQNLTAATGPTLIAVTNLAGTVCNKAVNNDIGAGSPAARLFFQEVNFSAGLSQGAAAFVPGFERVARNAWRRDVTPDEEGFMQSFVSEFADGANMTDPAQSKLLAISICTSVLSSMDALTY
jgi:hypothetical protein